MLRTSGWPAMTTASPSVSPSIRSVSVPWTLWLPSTGSASPDSPTTDGPHEQHTFEKSAIKAFHLSHVDTLVLSVAVAVPGSAHRVVFSLVLAGASLAPKETARLVNNS